MPVLTRIATDVNTAARRQFNVAPMLGDLMARKREALGRWHGVGREAQLPESIVT